MKNFLFILLFLGGLFGPPTHLENANKSYEDGKYAESIAAFEAALEQYPIKSQSIRYNIGQNHLAMDSLPKAMEAYERTFDDSDLELTSMAHNNKGVVQTRMAKAMQQALQQQMQAKQQAGQQQQAGPAAQGMDQQQMQQAMEQSSLLLKAAMETFKESMRKNPNNEEARFNYELLKRRLDQQQQQQQDQQQQNQDQKQDQQNKDQDQQNQDNQSKEQDKQDQDGDSQDQQKQKQDQSSKQQNKQQNRKPKEGKGEKAEYSEIPAGMEEQVLKAMEGKEKQFIQELRKSAKKNNRKTGGKDW